MLSRRQNNPVIGEAASGKTWSSKDWRRPSCTTKVPEDSSRTALHTLDLGSLVAGSRYRGDFERLREGAQEINTRGDIILFIDRLHLGRLLEPPARSRPPRS